MTLAELLSGRESFDDIRKMGPERSWAETQAELASQQRLREALGRNQPAQPVPTWQGLPQQMSLMDLIRSLMPSAQAAQK